MADNQMPRIPQGKLLDLELGESWSERRIITIKYDFKPASIDLSNATLNHGADGSVIIKVPDNDGSGNMTTVYTGHSYEPKAGILIYDEETGRMVLERINYAYRVKYTRPHNSAVVSEAPNPGDRRKVSQVQEVKRPPSSLSSSAKQPLAAAPASRSGCTPSLGSGQKKIPKGGKVMAPQQSEDIQPPPQVFFLPESDEEDNVITNITDSNSDNESDDDSSGDVNSHELKNEESVPRISPDCSSRSSGKLQNASTRKTQLTSSDSSSSDMELAFDDQSSNLYPPASSQSERNNPSRNSASNNNGGHFSSIPKGRFITNLSDSDS